MSWQTELVGQLRYIIHDLDSSNYTWTDAQLQNFLGIAAIRVSADLSNWDVPSFTFTFASTTIDPDPIEQSSVIQLLIMVKAACLIANSELKRTASQSGFTIVDDVSKIETKDMIKSAKEAVDTFCGDYDKAVRAYQEGTAFSGANDALAILSPYASQDGDGFTIMWG